MQSGLGCQALPARPARSGRSTLISDEKKLPCQDYFNTPTNTREKFMDLPDSWEQMFVRFIHKMLDLLRLNTNGKFKLGLHILAPKLMKRVFPLH